MNDEWVRTFAESLKELTSESNIEGDRKWTEFMVKVMKNIGEKIDCYVQTRDALDHNNSGEYMNIDALFFCNSDYKNWKSKDYDPPVLPIVAVEMENNYKVDKITYCLWKLLCLRVPTRVLICYQANMDNLLLLKKHFEETIVRYRLMDQDHGKLFIIVGDDREDGPNWDEYYKAFEWKNNKLENIKIF